MKTLPLPTPINPPDVSTRTDQNETSSVCPSVQLRNKTTAKKNKKCVMNGKNLIRSNTLPKNKFNLSSPRKADVIL
jgi:hypothetical protein